MSKVDWVHVADRLPQYETEVLVTASDSASRWARVMFLSVTDKMGHHWVDATNKGITRFDITHWAPLPEMPK